MLNVGDDAPEFELADQNGATVRLSELIKESPVIVYFYPADFSPVCTAQACGLWDSFAGIDQVKLKVVGISPQSVKSHDQFADRYDLPFPLLADTDRTAIRDFGAASHIELLEETAREA